MLKIGSLLLLSLIVPSSAYSLDLKQQTGEQCSYLFEKENTEYGWSGYCVKPDNQVYEIHHDTPYFRGKIGTSSPTDDFRYLKQFEIENNKIVVYECYTGGKGLECASSAEKTVFNYKRVSDRNGPTKPYLNFSIK